jgi:hypothetical protein
MYRTSPILATLAAITYINWFIFAGISSHFGGEALDVLPSKDGFIVTSHGHKTPVTESVWLFCLIYPYCTLMLSPAAFFLLGARLKPLGSLVPAGRWLIVAFFCLWSIGWYSGITKSFIRSLQDYRHLKSLNPTSQQTAPEH